MEDPHLHADEPEIAPHFEGELAVANLSLAENSCSRILDGKSLTVPRHRQIFVIGRAARHQRAGAVVGAANGPERLAQANVTSGPKEEFARPRSDLGIASRELRPQLRQRARVE
jgi:hypothetical protein